MHLRIDSLSATQVSLSWSSSVGPTSYIVDYNSNLGTTSDTITNTTYTTGRLTGATGESMDVRARNSFGTSAMKTSEFGSLIIIIDDAIFSKV